MREEARPAVAVVVDTNVFVAAGFNRRSAAADILQQLHAGTLRLVWNEQTRRETHYVLNKIPRLSWDGVSDLFCDEDRHDGPTDPGMFAEIPDPDDRKFAALAFATGAVLLSNDHDILDYRDQLQVEILTPGEFRHRQRGD